MTASSFVDAVLRNAARVHRYTKGHNGSDGECDCIGLISGAFLLMGLQFGAYGTNNAKRRCMQDIAPITSAGGLLVGEVVYKSRAPGEPYYDLPEAYKSDPDQNDYYHIGVVVSVSPLRIIHCTTVEGGIANDSSLGKWKWHGKLKGVEYDPNPDKEVTILTEKYVKSKNGRGANMRAQTTTNSALLTVVPENGKVGVIKEGPEWTRVSYGGYEGFVLTRLLTSVAPAVPVTEAPMEAAGAVTPEQLYNDFIPADEPVSVSNDYVTITMDRATAVAMLGYLSAVLGGVDGFHG